METLNEKTRDFIAINKVLSPFLPRTTYGQKKILKYEFIIKDTLSFDSHWSTTKKVLEIDRRRIERIRAFLSKIGDISEPVRNGFQTIGDFAKLKRFLYILHEISKDHSAVWNFPDFSEMYTELIRRTGNSVGFSIRDSEMLKLQRKHTSLTKEISREYEKLRARIENLYSVKLPHQDEFVCPRIMGEELLNSGLVEVVDETADRFLMKLRPSREILNLKEELLNLESKMKNIEKACLKDLITLTNKNTGILKLCEKVVERIDLDISRYDMYFALHCCIPRISQVISVKDGRFPPIQNYCEEHHYTYAPVTASLRRGTNVLYGPNMGGKTSFLRTVGLLISLTLMGFPVPAQEFETIPFRCIRYIDKGDSSGLSSFATEMNELVSSMRIDGTKLILMDEFASGTNPIEGEALAAAVIQYFSESSDVVLFTTHYPGVLNFGNNILMCGKLKNIDASDPHEMIDYKVEKGKMKCSSLALMLASKIGVPQEIIERAREYVESKNDGRKSLLGF